MQSHRQPTHDMKSSFLAESPLTTCASALNAFRAILAVLLLATVPLQGAELHVAPDGNNGNPGTRRAPLRTIQRAAELAQPGDVITVHEGVYRERINPPRGGESDRKRIVYRAARGARVEIKGSEVIDDWVKVRDDVWKVTLPNTYFGGFNPYTNVIRGDWFNPRGREHHTGAVYLNGDWLVEATHLDEVLDASGRAPAWFTQADDGYLLNVAWFRPDNGAQIPAATFAAQYGIQTARASEGGECIGWIDHGDWVRYERVDFGRRTEQIEFRAASASNGGIIEIRLDSPEGDLLGTCVVPNTGGWQSWSSFNARVKPVSGVRNVCFVFKSRKPGAFKAPMASPQLWFAQVDATHTTLWAQFKGMNPNEQLVEINVRQTVFYPDQPGRNFITVRGFILRHAATPWAPPTAEQIGLVGTHWSRGWVIEDNVISHSICSGVALGKHGDEFDNTSANTAEGYVKTIERGLARGWNRENIGGHVVRNNTISHCEQTGIVGSLGPIFSLVENNTIHDIHVRRLFSGAEMAGIKFHGAIDTVIRGNHIYRTTRGIWLDWMTQGTRVSGNLLHDNGPAEDLFVEVNHGPFLVDNNLLLSPLSLHDMSQGGAYVHNLLTGKIISRPESRRATPYHPAHSTTVAGLTNVRGGDNRFYNNVFVGNGEPAEAGDPQRAGGFGLWVYDFRELPLQTGGNVYFNDARPYAKETNPTVTSTAPEVWLNRENDRFHLRISPGKFLRETETTVIGTDTLGRASVPDLPYVNPDGSPLKIDSDYFGKRRGKSNPTPGPFENLGTGPATLRVR
jgi:alpha-L-arabinofuranosidase